MQPIDLKVTVDRPMPGAQDRVLETIESRMRSVRFAGHANGDAVIYRPRFTVPAVVWLVRRLQGEHVTLAFEQQGTVTEVRVTGKLGRRARAEVTEALGGD